MKLYSLLSLCSFSFYLSRVVAREFCFSDASVWFSLGLFVFEQISKMITCKNDALYYSLYIHFVLKCSVFLCVFVSLLWWWIDENFHTTKMFFNFTIVSTESSLFGFLRNILLEMFAMNQAPVWWATTNRITHDSKDTKWKKNWSTEIP